MVGSIEKRWRTASKIASRSDTTCALGSGLPSGPTPDRDFFAMAATRGFSATGSSISAFPSAMRSTFPLENIRSPMGSAPPGCHEPAEPTAPPTRGETSSDTARAVTRLRRASTLARISSRSTCAAMPPETRCAP